MERRLSAVLVTDVADFARLMADDEARTFERVTALQSEVIAPSVARHRGRVVKVTGDGHISEFPSATDALHAAASIIDANAARQEGFPTETRLRLRGGINLGDVLHTDSDIFGNGVNIAARLESIADPDSIYVSQTAAAAIHDRGRLRFADLGECRLKNIPDAIRVWRVTPAGSDHDVPDPAPRSRPIAVAVLPFRNNSGDPEQDYFCDGISEDIIIDLSKVSSIEVASRGASFAFKGSNTQPSRIGRDLGVSHIVEGSIRKSGIRIRVTAELIDASNGRQVWSERYDRELTDVFEVQDDISQSIVAALRAVISPIEKSAIERRTTSNPDAYGKYLVGREFLYAMTRVSIDHARRHFASAAQADPVYALPLAGLAECDALLYTYYDGNPDLIESAVATARQALALDPHSAPVRAALGRALALSGKHEASLREFDLAIELDPAHYDTYWYRGIVELQFSHFNEAFTAFRRAYEVRKGDLQSIMMQLGVLAGLDEPEEMRRTAMAARDLALARLRVNPGDAAAAHVAAQALQHLGDVAGALKWLDLAAELDTADPRTLYNLACGYAMAGRPDRALDLLEQSAAAGRPKHMISWTRLDPEMAALQDLPRFAEILERWQAGEI